MKSKSKISSVKEELRNQARLYEPPYTAEEIRRKFSLLGKMILPRGAAAFFYPLPKEPDLRRLAHDMAKRGTVLYPRIEGGKLVFVALENEGQFKEGPHGISEPSGEAYTGTIDLMFVPGLLFSRSGKRLGRGKGYYDRALEGFAGIRAGVCFEANLRDELPDEPHDAPMDFIITENQLIDCRNSYRPGV